MYLCAIACVCVCAYILFSGKYVLHFLLIWCCCYVCIPCHAIPLASTFLTYVLVSVRMLAYILYAYKNMFFRADFCGGAVRQMVSIKMHHHHPYWHTLTHSRTNHRKSRADMFEFCCKSKIMDWLLSKDHLWNKLQTTTNIPRKINLHLSGVWRRKATISMIRVRLVFAYGVDVHKCSPFDLDTKNR